MVSTLTSPSASKTLSFTINLESSLVVLVEKAHLDDQQGSEEQYADNLELQVLVFYDVRLEADYLD